MVSIYKHCQNCQKMLPADSTWRRKFCGDLCRVQFHRKPKPKDLYFDAMNVISQYAKTSKKDRIDAIDNLKALKVQIDSVLLQLGEQNQVARRDMLNDYGAKREAIKAASNPSHEERIAAIYDVDPTKYD